MSGFFQTGRTLGNGKVEEELHDNRDSSER